MKCDGVETEYSRIGSFSAVLRLLGVVETSYTETALLLGVGAPVRPGSTLWCCVCWAVYFLFRSGSSPEKEGSFGIGVVRGSWGGCWGAGMGCGVVWGWRAGCGGGVWELGVCVCVGGGDGSGVWCGGGWGEWLEIVFLAVGVPFVLVSFLFALCFDMSVEERGDFSGDSVLSLDFFGVFSLLKVSVIARLLKMNRV